MHKIFKVFKKLKYHSFATACSLNLFLFAYSNFSNPFCYQDFENKTNKQLNESFEIDNCPENSFIIIGELTDIELELISNLTNLNIKCVYDNKIHAAKKIIAKNRLNKIREFEIKDQRDFKKVENFFDPPTLISDEIKLTELINDLSEEENIIIGHCEEENEFFNELRYRFMDKNSKFYYINNENLAGELKIKENEIICLRKDLKKNNYQIQGTNLFSQKLKASIDFDKSLFDLYDTIRSKVGVLVIDNHLINLLKICDEMKIKQFLIVSLLYKNDQLQNKRLVQKLERVIENLEKDKHIQIIISQNDDLLKKYFRIIPDKYMDTIRLIDFSSKSIIQRQSGYGYIYDNIENNQPITNYNFYEQIIPENYKVSLEENFYRTKYEGKITAQKIEDFIRNSSNKKVEMYYENDFLINHSQYSKTITGKKFKQEVLDSNQDFVIFFYKPQCNSCKILSKGYEKFAKTIEDIQEYLEKVSNSQDEYKKFADNIINKYRILHPEKYKNLVIAKYNVFNESPYFANPSNTPLIILMFKDRNILVIDLLKERVNVQSEEDIVKSLIRKIDDY